MNFIFFDDAQRDYLLPLCFTRPTAELRIGILTNAEKWQKRLEGTFSYRTQDYLQSKYPQKSATENVYLNGAVCANDALAQAVAELSPGQALRSGAVLLAARAENDFDQSSLLATAKDYPGEFIYLSRPYHIFQHNAVELERDFELITKGRKSAALSDTNTIIGERIFAEAGARAEAAIFNTSSGPIYLGKDSEVMEGSVVRGGLALCEHAVLKLSAKIYGATTLGPYCKVGGEVNNSVFIGYSNKGHDGFLGNSVVGEWCNIGADTNNSNLKNNYAEVKLWSYPLGRFTKTGLQFCGLVMGDHSKCGINTMFNTGTVIGVSANIFGAGFPRNFIPSFSWGGAAGFSDYLPGKAFETAQLIMERRGKNLDATERDILQHIFDKTAALRH